MPALTIGTFRGALPRVDPRLLPETNAVEATNCLYEHGNLEPLRSLLHVSGTIKDNAKTLFHYLDEHWFSWTEAVHAVRSPIPKDPYQRVYFTGTDCPRYTKQDIAIGASMPNASIKLGIPKPGGIIAAVGTGSSGDVVDETNDESRFYTFTWVSDTGEEGPPADPSMMINVDEPEHDNIPLTLPAIGTNDRNITHRRIYRSATTADSTDWYLVAELPVETTSYTDKVRAESLSALLATHNYFPPPETMQGLTALANGVLIGFDGNILCPSEPNLPYAYNPDNQLACEFDIVAIGALPSGAVIATTGQPYLLQGYTPDSFQLIKLESSAPCVSARSLVDMGSVVLYASSEGLVAVGGGEPEIVTRSLMTKEQWQALKPETIHAYQHGDKYVAFSDAGGFIVDQSGPDITLLSLSADTGLRLPATEDLVLAINDQLYRYDAGTGRLPMSWHSKTFKTTPTSYSAGKVVGHNVTVTIYRDGQVLHSQVIGSDLETVFRLPPGRGSEWAVEVTGTGEVQTISLGNSVAELV